MNERNKKTSIITIRCTQDMEKKIKTKAKQLGKPVSEFAMDCISTGLIKKVRRDKKKATVLVEAQEALNVMILEIGGAPDKQELRQKLVNLSKEMTGLWDY